MLIKAREKSLELILFDYLSLRMCFSKDEAKQHYNLKKGYEGEKKSDEWIQKELTDYWLVLHDLLLEHNGSRFQIDTLIVAYETLYLLDNKYFEGDYSIKDDKWFNPSDILQKNPLHQLERCETLLQKLLLDLGFDHSIKSHLTFNNPEFHLNTTTIYPPIIYPAQLNRFIKKLNTKSKQLTNRHFQLAKQLVARHINESPYNRLPKYSLESLKKGIFCLKCNCFYSGISGENMVCMKCGHEESTETAILRTVNEFALLFPDRKITTNDIYEWCDGIKSKKAIRRVLNKHFTLLGKARASYYVKT